MNAIDQSKLGLYGKFNITRVDGLDAVGERHHGDKYFVLNTTTDPHSIPAIAAYAESCAATYPELARDLKSMISEHMQKSSEYITVPEVKLPSGLVVPSFKVGKYISSRGPLDTPISTESGKPWVEINYHEAIAAAQSNSLNLLTETQALAIAYDISQQDINWTDGKVGKGKIFQGIHKDNVSEAQIGEYVSSDAKERRWHGLSSGERIYDFSGNCFTWIFDDVQGNEKGLTGKIAADSISLTTAPYPSEEQGMGWYPEGGANWSGVALVRGGCWHSGSYAGVFCLGSGLPDRRGDYIGFRCTKSL